MCIYGYCRISRKSQNIERQVRNITAAFPTAHIIKEAFTGTKIEGRKELDKLLKVLKENDTVIFDSASRMSRNADEAITLYEELYNKGINLVFLKEPHINTDTYKRALQNQIEINLNTGNAATDTFINSIIQALNKYTIDLAKEQIRLVFAQAQKEVDDLHQRTAEGITTARLNGKQIGQQQGAKLTTKKSIAAKEQIKKYSSDFGGSLDDSEVIKLTGIARNTYYKYKREIREEIAGV
jgi:DNA invertase Pin-like site-specific DNA recombinase